MQDQILLVDDDPSVLSALVRTLRNEPYEKVTTLSAEHALELMQQQQFKVVVSDERMARMQGSQFLARVRELYPAVIRILLTGQASLEAAMRAVNQGGAYKFLTKPWSDQELRQILQEAIARHDAEHEAVRLVTALMQQQQDLAGLETLYPGISRLDRDLDGQLQLPDLTDTALDALRKQCSQLLSDGVDELTAPPEVHP